MIIHKINFDGTIHYREYDKATDTYGKRISPDRIPQNAAI